MKYIAFFLFLIQPFAFFAAPYEVLGLGECCVDYVMQVSQKGTDAWQEMDEKGFTELLEVASKIAPPLRATGGCGANTIKGLASLGKRSAFAGKIGADALGTYLTETFSQEGVTPLFIQSKEAPTARIGCLLPPDGERYFLACLGAVLTTSEEDLAPHWFRGTKLVHFEGYSFKYGRFNERGMQFASAAGALVSLDLGNKVVVEAFREYLIALLPKYVDVVFANEEEALALTGLPPEPACKKLAELCPIAVVKIGDQGCWVGSKERIFKLPAIKAEVVDTTGAGDLFASGFLYGLLNGASLEECARYGTLTGHAVVSVKGATLSRPTWASLKNQMHR